MKTLLVALAAVAALFLPGNAFAADSPTGRNPRLLWTPAQQDIYNRMIREDHPLWQSARTGCEQNYGWEHSTLCYGMTGDRQWAEQAWSSLQDWFEEHPEPTTHNDTTHSLIGLAWVYDWLHPWMSSAQREQFRARARVWMDWAKNSDTRTGDTDVVYGHYFGWLLWDQATGDNYLGGTYNAGGEEHPVGGLVATGADDTTLRNVIRSHFESQMTSGMFHEGGQYNISTIPLVALGFEGARTATGRNDFPEIAGYFTQAGITTRYEYTPDFRQMIQWADNEHPRSWWNPPQVSTLRMMAGLARRQELPNSGYLQRTVQEWLEAGRRFEPGNFWDRPYPRALLLWNPYDDGDDYRPVFEQGRAAPELGMLWYADGWTPSSSLFWSAMYPGLGIDHSTSVFEFELYRKGEWALTRRLGYLAGPTAANGALIAGRTDFWDTHGQLDHEFGPGYVYQVGSSSGAVHASGTWGLPPIFAHEWTRSLFYLPSSDRNSDTIVLLDRIKADDPRRELVEDHWYPYSFYELERSRIEAPHATDLALKQLVFHAPVRPSLDADAMSWRTEGGQSIRIQTLVPERFGRTVFDERADDVTENVHPEELGYQMRIYPDPAAQRRFDTFVNVIEARDGDQPPATSTVVESTDGVMRSARIQRAGHRDVVVLGNAVEAPDLRQPLYEGGFGYIEPENFERAPFLRLTRRSFELHLTAGTAAADVLVADLDPTVGWQLALDEGEPTSVRFTSGGLVRVNLDGARSHTLRFTSSASPSSDLRVRLTAPGAEARFEAPATIELAAAASGTSSAIEAVEFYEGSRLLGEDRTAPYAFTWRDVPAGSYELTGRVRDASGRTARSSPQTVTVTSVASQPGTGDDAAFVYLHAPTAMEAGQRYRVTVAMLNTGTTTWSAAQGYRLGRTDWWSGGKLWGVDRADLPSDVTPGEQATFDFLVRAPERPGRYPFAWRMVFGNGAYFGDATPELTVEVTGS